MTRNAMKWAPALVLFAGAALSFGTVHKQRSMPLRASLEEVVPATLDGYVSRDIEVSQEEQAVAGMDSYVMRVYEPKSGAGGTEFFSVYVGYYDRQTQGKTIHSPQNCLPGAGWEPLVSGRETIATGQGDVPVNRYVIQNGVQRALVLYWYQGRGRVAANEYRVKWDLLRDQALHGRSDEALLRVIVPITGSEGEAYTQAVRVAQSLISAVDQALPV